MGLTKKIILAYLFMCLFACEEPKKLTKEKYVRWIESLENNAFQIIESNSLSIKCQFLPSDYIILKELENGVLSQDEKKNRRIELTKFLNFRLSIIGKNGKSILKGPNISESQESIRETYLRKDLKNDILLEAENKQSLSPILVQLVRNYGIKQEVDLMLVFENSEKIQKFDFIINNRIIDTISFKLEFNLDQIPQLIN